MAWQPTGYSLIAFGAAAISFIVAGAAFRYRANPETVPLVALMCSLGGWSLCYAVQLGYTTVTAQVFWQSVGLVIGGLIPPLWFLFAVEYAGATNRFGRRGRALLAIDPVLFGLLTFTNQHHGLVWEQASFVSGTVPRVVYLSLGVGYYIHIVYAYLLVGGGVGLLFLIVSRTSSFYRKQAGIMIFAALPPTITNIAFTLRIQWGPLPALDLTPFAFVVSGALVSLALFRFDLLERSPVARQQILDEMGDGYVVLDTDGEIVDSNRIATEITSTTPAAREVIESTASVDSAERDVGVDSTPGGTIMATVSGRQRAYDIQRSPLRDHRGRLVGNVIAFRDVTERNAHEQRLSVTQRLFRHNLRNKMNVVRGWAELLDETPVNGGSVAPRRIIDTADELIDMAEKTQQMVALSGQESADMTEVNVEYHLAHLVEELRRGYPEATIESSFSIDGGIRLPDEDVLMVAVRNLVENAIEHNDSETPWVEIGGHRTDEVVRIIVADNGPGIPPTERAVLEAGTETPLEHGSGIGLWLTYWCVTVIGGEITFSGREPRGSIVTLSFPAS